MSGPATDKTGQIVKRNGKGDDLPTLIKRLEPEIRRALPKHVTADRMARICLTALRTTPKLMQCSPPSFMACVMSLAQLGLEPNTPLGHAYLIPRNNRRMGGMECTLQLGYQGYLDLARRSGLVSNVYAYVVREGDEFSYQLGLHPDLRHVPSDTPDRESQPITHVYGVAHVKDAEPMFVVATKAQIEARRARSAAKDSGPWTTDYEAMCQKTAIRMLWKWLPKSTEIAGALQVEAEVDAGRAPVALLDTQATGALARAGVYVAPESETVNGETVEAEPGEAEETTDEGSELDQLALELKQAIATAETQKALLGIRKDQKNLIEQLRQEKPGILAAIDALTRDRKAELA